MGVKVPAVGSVWEGRCKNWEQPLRRRVVAVTDVGVQWEPVGTPPRSGAKPVVALSTWNSWVKREIKGVTR